MTMPDTTPTHETADAMAEECKRAIEFFVPAMLTRAQHDAHKTLHAAIDRMRDALAEAQAAEVASGDSHCTKAHVIDGEEVSLVDLADAWRLMQHELLALPPGFKLMPMPAFNGPTKRPSKTVNHTGQTPLSDELESARLGMRQSRTAAYGDALALCRRLESALAAPPAPAAEPDDLMIWKARALQSEAVIAKFMHQPAPAAELIEDGKKAAAELTAEIERAQGAAT